MQRIQISNGQRPCRHRTRARSASWPNRNAILFRPLNEVRDNQEITGKPHFRDDIELIIKPFPIFGSHRVIGARVIHAANQTLGRHGADRFFLSRTLPDLGADRQQRLTGFRHDGAGPCDGECIVAGFRQVGEQRPHHGRRLEPVFRSHPAALLLRQQPALGDAQQRILGFMHGLGREHTIVCGNQRKPEFIRQCDQSRLDRLFDRQAVPVQFHDRPAGEGFGQRGQQTFSVLLLALGQQAGDGTGGAASQQKQTFGVAQQHIQRDTGFQRRVGIQKAFRRQALQIGQTGGVARQQNQRIGGEPGIIGPGQRDLTADDGLNPFAGTVLGKFQRAEQVAGIGDGDGGHLRVACQRRDLVDLDRPFAKGISRVNPEMDEISVSHRGTLAGPVESGVEADVTAH